MKRFNTFILVLFITLAHPHCTDPCEGINCLNGYCEEGTCLCDDGYEGIDCSIRKSLQFTGQWTGQFDCGNLSETGVLMIEDSQEDLRAITLQSEGLEIGFDGIFFNLDNTKLQATINVNYTGFVIDTQSMTIQIPGNPGISAYVFGAGNLENDQELSIQINVKNDDFGAAFRCEGTVNKP